MNTRSSFWTDNHDIKALLEMLGAPKVDVRVVGGYVRNWVMGLPVVEADIATPEMPDTVTKRLETKGIKVIPTGLDHGTVTALVKGRGFEITTLRHDVATDGRHAVVAPITDWKEDAARRDFTMNAMSVNLAGELFDYHGGVADAESGRVRFVGDPAARIQEDYLRILRLFRFYAWYGREPIEAATLDAIRKNAKGLAQLSAERVQQELSKLLAAKDPGPAVKAMFDAGIAQYILPGAVSADALAALIKIEPAAPAFPPHWLRRLAALVPSADHLKLSNADRERLALITDKVAIANAKDLQRALYRFGAAVVVDRLLLSANTAFLREAAAWTEKTLPVSGKDVLALGNAPGPKVGALLAAVEEWWIAADFKPSRDEAVAKLQDLAQKK